MESQSQASKRPFIPSFYRDSDIKNWYSVIVNSDEGNKKISKENIFIDYDSKSYVRLMKKFELDGVKADVANVISNQWEKDKQNEFFLRFYLPKKKISRRLKESRIDHLIIMFNGLDEFMGYDLYDVLGAQFAEQGFASVLLPTPYHLNRRIIDKDNTTDQQKPRYMKPTNLAQKELAMMYFYNFKKSIRELEHLIDSISTDSLSYGFYHTYFVEKPKITLFGYSLGGLRALSAFLKLKENHEIHSCITFNTGPDLTKAKVGKIKVNRKIWKETMDALKIKIKDPVFENEENTEFTKLFKWLYLGLPDKTLTLRLQRHANECLSIQSGGDKTVAVNSHNHISNPKHGLNRLIVAGVDHSPSEDIKWESWLPKVGENIIHFIKGCDEHNFDYKELGKELKAIILPTAYIQSIIKSKLSKSKIEELDFTLKNFNDMEMEIRDTQNKARAKTFIELYYVSKAFYPRFGELVAKVLYTKYFDKDFSMKKKRRK